MTWLQRPLPRPSARLRLVCLPYATGPASAHFGWAPRLPEDVELLAVELPGHGGRRTDPPVTSIAEAVDAVLDELVALPPRPTAVYGHCMGALLALELARGMRRSLGHPPAALLVASSDAPSATMPEIDPSEAYWIDRMRNLGGMDVGAITEEHVLPGLRYDIAMLRNYRYQDETPLRCPVRVYSGISDATVSATGLDAWRQQGPDDFRSYRLPGGHFFIRESVDLHLTRLSMDITEIQATSHGATR
jgi:pyochelin biosynthesis protein PchC